VADNFGIMVYKLRDLKAGKEDADPYIRPGDIVIVTEAEPVYITGSVVSPRELPLRDQLTLGQAIAMSGGPQKLAKTNEVYIYRQKEGSGLGQETLKYNYDAIKKGKAPDVLLKPYDIVDVGESGLFTPKGAKDMFTNIFRGTVGIVTQRGIIP
jgi:polysaccharide export outer membrane protein